MLAKARLCVKLCDKKIRLNFFVVNVKVVSHGTANIPTSLVRFMLCIVRGTVLRVNYQYV